MKRKLQIEFHILTLLFSGISASYWAIFSTCFLIPTIWLFFLLTLVSLNNFAELFRFLKRFIKFGLALFIFSIIHLIFRREGTILVKFLNFPLIYSRGLEEAILLWLRFLNLFAMASLFARISPFKFILLGNKIGIPMNFNLLLLTTLRIFPFMVNEVKYGLWFLRFRGICIESLRLREKITAGRQLLYALFIKSLQNGSWSALALELRGYGSNSNGKIKQKYPLGWMDYLILFLVIMLNLYLNQAFGFWQLAISD